MIVCSICAHSDWCDENCDCACHDPVDEFDDVEDDLDEDDDDFDYEED